MSVRLFSPRRASLAAALFGAVLAVAVTGCEPVRDERLPEPPPLLKPLPPATGPQATTLTAGARRYSIDLSATLALAGAGSFEIAIAREQTNELAARALRFQQVFVPSFGPVGWARAHDGMVQRSTGQFVPDVDKQQVYGALVATVRFDAAGSILAALAAAQRETAGEAALTATRNDVLLAATASYFQLVGSRARIEVALQAVAEGEELLKVQDDKYRAGGGGVGQKGGLKVDVLTAKAELERQRQVLIDAQAAEREASVRLATILGFDPSVILVPFEERPVPVSFVREDSTEDALIREALERRPEVVEARALLRAAGYDESATTWGPALPTLEGDVAVGGLGPHPDATNYSNDYAAFVGWRIGPGGLFDLGAMRETRARLEQQRLRLGQLEQRVAAEVVTARLRELASRQRLASAREGVVAAEGALAFAQDRVKNDVAIILEQLDAERAYTLARQREIDAIIEFNNATFALMRAVGEPAGARGAR
jgi:outer membrane protein TolC